MSKESTFTFRVPEDVKKAFDEACKTADRTAAQVLREHMKNYTEWVSKNYTKKESEK